MCYEVEPIDEDGREKKRRGNGEPVPRLDEPGILEGFDPDTDFDEPPEKSLRGKAGLPDPAEVEDDRLPVVTEGSRIPLLGSVKVLAGMGGALAIAAIIFAGVNAVTRPFVSAVLTAYEIAVHTGTGVVAVLLMAYFAERRVNLLALAAARMFVAVAGFYLLFSLDTTILWRLDEMLMGAIFYGLAVVGLFRLPRFELGVLVGGHFCLWAVVMIGGQLYQLRSAG